MVLVETKHTTETEEAKMETIRNTFHNTEARTLLTREELDAARYQSVGEAKAYGTDHDVLVARAGRRLWTQLCGIDGCTCGTWYGGRE